MVYHTEDDIMEHFLPEMIENVTVAFSPASRSLANMLVTTEPTDIPDHTCHIQHMNKDSRVLQSFIQVE